ncbi:MAG: cytochrome c [Gemmatimonadetes bacterium]|nr:cytochrome c [Gemmatimonadota bacterium]
MIHSGRTGRRTLLAGLLYAALAAGCGDDMTGGDGDGHDHDHDAASSGAECSPTATATYDNFGAAFFDQYCLRCHSRELSGADRNDAPPEHNFDTVDLIHAQREIIDGQAAIGPGSTNRSMPPSAPFPTDEERRTLGEWLACHTP